MQRSFARGAVAAVTIVAAAACGAFESAGTPSSTDAGAEASASSSSDLDAASPDAAADRSVDAPACTLDVECMPGTTLGTDCFKYSNSGAWPSGGVVPTVKGSEGFLFATTSAEVGFVTRPLARTPNRDLNLDLDLSSFGRFVVGRIASGEGEITVEARDTTYVTCISPGGGATRVCSSPTPRPAGPANHRLRWSVKIGALTVSSTLATCEPPVTIGTSQTTEFSADAGELTVNVGINRVLVGANASIGVDRLRWSYR